MSQWVYELVCLQNSVQVYDIYLEISIGLLGVPKSMSDNLMRLKGGVYKFSSRVMEIRLDEMILISDKGHFGPLCRDLSSDCVANHSLICFSWFFLKTKALKV